MFLGEYQHTIDDKGRLAIPARFRPPLAEGLVVTRGIDRCLYVLPRADWEELAEKLRKLPLMQKDARRVRLHLFSGATDTTLDRLGRMVVPQFLREYAGLGDEAVVVGNDTRIEIWSKANWEEELSVAEREMPTFAEHLASLGI